MRLSAREIALNAILAARKSQTGPDILLGDLIKKANPDPRDAALAFRLCYGVLQNDRLCDFYISAYSTVKINKMESIVAEILRIGVYQLLFLTRIPPSAAVNDGVELTKKRANPRAAGLVNAVLRKIAQNRDNLPEIPGEDEIFHLATRYSHPEWLVKRLLEALPADECEAFLRLNNTPPETAIQINTLKASTGDVHAALEQSGVEVQAHPFVPDCLVLNSASNITRLPGFTAGHFFVQDPAARLAALAAGLQPGMTVIDGCAAPGGKSFAAAIAMQGEGHITACDLHAKKLPLIMDGADRLGISIIETRAADGRIFIPELAESAEVVIADVPCSGLGVIRKKPDIRHKTPEEISALPEIQLAILKNLSRYVRPGGVIIYSTCTVLQQENEDIVRDFLSGQSDFASETFELPGLGAVPGQITLWPQRHGTDGFYIARLKRT